MVFGPVYHPFFLVTEHNGRDVVRHPLVLTDETDTRLISDSYATIARCKDSCTKQSSQPWRRVWTADELRTIAELLP